MDRKTIRLQARLGAIEYMIAELFKKFYEINDVSLKQVQKEHEFLRTYLQKMTLQIPDPALSDLTAGEMMDAFERLMERSRWQFGGDDAANGSSITPSVRDGTRPLAPRCPPQTFAVQQPISALRPKAHMVRERNCRRFCPCQVSL